MTKALALALVAPLLAAAAACSDLFHSTDDVRTACETNPRAPECAAPPDAGLAPLDFCAWSPATAKLQAAHACAWLGACETPMGGNAFGSCMFQALLAYDCTSNPNHRVQGPLHDLWACLALAQTCDAVSRCVLPPGMGECAAGDYTACSNDSTNGMVRLECVDGGVHGENCGLWAESCVTSNGAAFCTSPGECGAGGPLRCDNGQLFCARNGGNLAFDCSGNGDKMCVGLPMANVHWVACTPSGADPDADAACPASLAASCLAGVASSCPAAISEEIDCATLLGTTAACNEGTLSPPFDWTSPCAVTPPQCLADTCGEGGAPAPTTLTGCVRGATYPLDCTAQGLGPCRAVPTDVGAQQNPACTPP